MNILVRGSRGREEETDLSLVWIGHLLFTFFHFKLSVKLLPGLTFL